MATYITGRPFDALTQGDAIDILIARMTHRWPDLDVARERAILARWSRARLLHAVGAQLYGDHDAINEAMMAYAYAHMTRDERREIEMAG